LREGREELVDTIDDLQEATPGEARRPLAGLAARGIDTTRFG
jgi:hypothetical protein